MKIAKRPAAAAAGGPQNGNGHPPEEVIRQRAYELYEERGCINGLDIEDWLAAEAELQQSMPV